MKNDNWTGDFGETGSTSSTRSPRVFADPRPRRCPGAGEVVRPTSRRAG